MQRLQYKSTWLLLLLICSFSATSVIVLAEASAAASVDQKEDGAGEEVVVDDTSKSNGNKGKDEEDEKLLQETIAAGRGHRDDVGVRDQWSSTAHIGDKFDTRKAPLSDKIQKLLRDYRLKCDGCDQQEAVAKINAFVLETKEVSARKSRRDTWLGIIAKVVAMAAAFAAYMVYTGKDGFTVGNNNSGDRTYTRRLEIEEQRNRASKKLEEAEKAASAAASAAPSWRENEEQEVWTPKQEKQFAKAIISFGGVPPKGRYTLVADKVDGKTKQECLMHHKLLMLLLNEEYAKEE